MKKITILNIIRNFIFSVFVATSFSNITLAQTPLTTDSRIRTLVYNPNEVHELKFYYGYQSFIEFSDDEEIEMISIGEAFAWRLTPAGKRLFVRPLEIAAHTNMTIITNRRTYHFDIRSAEFEGKADEDLVYTVRFFYPQEGQPLPIPPQLVVANPVAAPKPQLPAIVRTPLPGARVDSGLPSVIERNPEDAQLNFLYSMAGKANNITPLKVYDDGNETHFQFPKDNATIPTISAVDVSGNEYELSYSIRDNYVVVPTVARQFTFRLGDALLCIYNNKALGVQ